MSHHNRRRFLTQTAGLGSILGRGLALLWALVRRNAQVHNAPQRRFAFAAMPRCFTGNSRYRTQNACNLLLGFGAAALPASNPYRGSKTGSIFHFRSPERLGRRGKFRERGLRAAWCAKWLVHRRLRPEAFGGRVQNLLSGAASYPMHRDLLNSAALQLTRERFGSYLLPLAYPEGSPAHPSYPAGARGQYRRMRHRAESLLQRGSRDPRSGRALEDGMSLVPYTGPSLTVGGELNKLAANIAIALNAAGVRYRSDGIEGFC